MSSIRKIIMASCAAFLVAGSAVAQQAKDFPSKSINLVVVFGAGGTSDAVARILADPLGQALNTQVVVENKPGASGNIGAAHVARAAPDGYTLLAGFPGLTTNASLYSNLNYDPRKDFTPISLLASAPNVIVTHPGLPVNSVEELLKHAAKQPDGVNFGSAGAGASSHLAGELLKEIAGIQMTHVPYKGGAPALVDLASGRLDLMVIPLPEAISLINAGKLKALALASGQRSPLLPDVPTTKEAGLDDFEVGSWYGLLAPANTPPETVQKIGAAVNEALQSEKVRTAFQAQGIELVGSDAATFGKFLEDETARWARVIETNNIRLN